MRSPCCLYACESPLLNLECLNQSLRNLVMCIMASEPTSTVYFRNPSHQSVCLYVYPPVVARQRLDKFYPPFHC
jgi:hypothetical protein